MAEIKRNMVEKICMVTGSTSGIGLATAHALVEKGATVIMVGRNTQKANVIMKEIKQTTPDASVDALIGDLSEFDQVRQLTREFKENYQRLDVLINNAGGYYFRRTENSAGVEMTFALNHLGHFLLTNLLQEMILASAPARIVNVSSGSHIGQLLDFSNLQLTTGYTGMKAYGQSKLANLYFTYELARRLEGTGVTVNALHPGFVRTNIGANNFGPLGSLVRKAIDLFAGDVSKGAATVVYLASNPDVSGVTGKYFVDCEPVPSSDASYDEATAKHLWEVSAEIVNLV